MERTHPAYIVQFSYTSLTEGLQYADTKDCRTEPWNALMNSDGLVIVSRLSETIINAEVDDPGCQFERLWDVRLPYGLDEDVYFVDPEAAARSPELAQICS